MLSKLYPNLIDARFSESNLPNEPIYKDMRDVLDKLSLVDKSVSEAYHLKYKYLISVDGNTCAWKRVPWIMLSNSVLVKQETDRTEWFYPALKPYVNYETVAR